ncbi:hypothetical protein ACPA1H_24580 [Ectopseudomonas chengduensis]|jgi:hypothetical protein|nr:hypothetical protein [Pseudomonas sp. WS 5019]NMY17896.1 hypothetical protein [Pseudomonas sp. WS 5019]
MPPKMGLRVSSCFHNAFSAVDCQEISGRFWPTAASHDRQLSAKSGHLVPLNQWLSNSMVAAD